MMLFFLDTLLLMTVAGGPPSGLLVVESCKVFIN